MNIWDQSIGQSSVGVTVNTTNCEFDSHSRKLNISYFDFFPLVSNQSAALGPSTQHAMYPEFGGKRGTVRFETRFPLPTRTQHGMQRKAKKKDILFTY